MSNLVARLYTWVTDKANVVKITASRQDAELDQIIASLNRKVLCAGSAPSSPVAGQTWFDTTNKWLKCYRNNEWVIQGIVHVGTTAPATVQEGDLWYKTSDDILYQYSGTAWTSVTKRPVSGARKNLAVSRTNVTTVAVTYDELITDSGTRITSGSLSAAITTSGANGLDTGAEASGTWYYIWVIRKSSDGTVALLLSVSSSSPTMPTDYDEKVLVSAVRNDGSSNFVSFRQTNRDYAYLTPQSAASGNVGLANWVSVDTSPFVPSVLSNQCYGTIAANSAGVANVDSGTSSGTINPGQVYNDGSASDTAFWMFDILTANTLYFAGNAAGDILYINGFKLNKVQS